MELRNVVTVSKELLEVIPETETELIRDIQEYSSGLWNQAPELLQGTQFWTPLQTILKKHITVFDEPWKIKVKDIFANA